MSRALRVRGCRILEMARSGRTTARQFEMEVRTMSSQAIPNRPIDRRVFVAGLGAALLAGCAPRSAETSSTADGADTRLRSDLRSRPSLSAEQPGGLLDAIERRRSIRTYTAAAIREEDIALLAWAAQGVTNVERGLRAAPSALAAYPLRLYVATAKSLRLYEPGENGFSPVRDQDVRPELVESSGQSSVGQAPVVFVLTGRYGVLEQELAEKAQRCVHLEAGHAAQNLVLTATSLGLGSVTAGSFEDSMVRRVLGANEDETPLYLIPVGHPA